LPLAIEKDIIVKELRISPKARSNRADGNYNFILILEKYLLYCLLAIFKSGFHKAQIDLFIAIDATICSFGSNLDSSDNRAVI
jgi:hypothetical protein